MAKESKKNPNLDINDEREVRLAKLSNLKELGIAPYPSKGVAHTSIKSALETEEGKNLTISGRLMSKREMGKLCFGHLEDETGRIQVVLKQNEVEKDNFKLFVKKIDLGDILNIQGERFVTQKGEQSILIKDWKILSKSLRPLPDKFYGLQDEELRLRKRYLDFIANPDLRQRFYRKSRFWQSMREFLIKEKFLEVETPVLESTAGGADATPFSTHHNALDMDVFLRISMGELWQKRLMVAGFEKTFEIGRQFRNEGMSREHLQDYTQMEFYWAYANYEDSMALVEKMYKYVIKETFGTLEFDIGKFEGIDLSKDWQRIDYAEEVKKQTGVDIKEATETVLRKKLDELEIKYEDFEGRGRLIDSLWKYCRKNIAGPVFLVHHPVDVSPLAKRHETLHNATERYQVIIAGSEIGNGYSELNDPLDQADRFREQAKMREAGDSEAQMHDADFVEALEHGMPPTSGFGVSERLFSFLEDTPIRECVMFPLMKPEHHEDSGNSGKSKKSMSVHVVLLQDKARPAWTKMNALAHLNASFGAREGKKLIHLNSSETSDGMEIPMNIQHAILIKDTDSNEKLLELKTKAEIENMHVECFTEAMQETSNDLKVAELHKQVEKDDLQILGVLVYGERKKIEKLTKEFELVK